MLHNNIFDSIISEDEEKNKLDDIYDIANMYNKILWKYTKDFKGKIALPTNDFSKISKKIMNLEEYINSKSKWKNILKFLSVIDENMSVTDYIDTMIKNWQEISIYSNCNSSTPKSNIIFSPKLIKKYYEFKENEKNTIEINKHLNITHDSEFYRLNPSMQSNINSLFRLKDINSSLSYKDIVMIFTGEFEQEFKDVINKLDEKEIDRERLAKFFR